MARSMNHVMLLGNVGKDPEVTYTQGGTAKAKFSLCTNKSWKDKQSGEWQERANWHNIICWGNTAETAGKFLAKGRQVLVRGEIENRSWEDRNTGDTKYITEIIVNELILLNDGSKRDGQSGGGYQKQGGGYQKPPQQGGQQGFAQGDPNDDDIPF